MFQTHLRPEGIDVRVDASSGRPLEIRTGGHRLHVTALEAVRDETAAYPVERGPRRVFVLRASGRRFRLSHLIRDQRWTLEELTQDLPGLTMAA